MIANQARRLSLLARIVQLEKRSTVIGDRSAGAVMRSKAHGHELGMDTIIPYGVSITDADIVMSDGKSLERVGVVPDEIRLATAADMSAKLSAIRCCPMRLLWLASH